MATIDHPRIPPPAPPTRRARPVPVVFVLSVAMAWVVVGAVALFGASSSVHQHGAGNGLDPVRVALFGAAWLVMIVAMMLPSTLPMIGMFRTAAKAHPRPRGAIFAFLAGYLVLWSLFGVVALAGDVGVHRLVDAVPWLPPRGWLIAAGVLAVAGAFQFSSLRERCLHVCRHPFAYLLHHFRPGTTAGFALGWHHGLFCLGCCWALMLLMFGVGVTNLVGMAALTAVMVYEKVGRHGERLARAVGTGLLVAAIVVATAGLLTPTAATGPSAAPTGVHEHAQEQP